MILEKAAPLSFYLQTLHSSKDPLTTAYALQFFLYRATEWAPEETKSLSAADVSVVLAACSAYPADVNVLENSVKLLTFLVINPALAATAESGGSESHRCHRESHRRR
jgi:hypothetical protein